MGGYGQCGRELQGQVPHLQTVVVAVGSGGTMAGLVAALGAEHVLGVDTGAIPDPLATVAAFVNDMNLGEVMPTELTMRRDQVGEGYGDYPAETDAALRLAARKWMWLWCRSSDTKATSTNGPRAYPSFARVGLFEGMRVRD